MMFYVFSLQGSRAGSRLSKRSAGVAAKSKKQQKQEKGGRAMSISMHMDSIDMMLLIYLVHIMWIMWMWAMSLLQDEDDEVEFELFAHNFEALCRIQTMKAAWVILKTEHDLYRNS